MALALLLYTGQRGRSDVTRMGRQHLVETNDPDLRKLKNYLGAPTPYQIRRRGTGGRDCLDAGAVRVLRFLEHYSQRLLVRPNGPARLHRRSEVLRRVTPARIATLAGVSTKHALGGVWVRLGPASTQALSRQAREAAIQAQEAEAVALDAAY